MISFRGCLRWLYSPPASLGTSPNPLKPKILSTSPPRHRTLTERPPLIAYCRTTNRYSGLKFASSFAPASRWRVLGRALGRSGWLVLPTFCLWTFNEFVCGNVIGLQPRFERSAADCADRVTRVRYQELLFRASVLGAAIALNNCRHPRNMRPEPPVFQPGTLP
jgi:hypothetical protein